jgi:hypothetical protein
VFSRGTSGDIYDANAAVAIPTREPILKTRSPLRRDPAREHMNQIFHRDSEPEGLCLEPPTAQVPVEEAPFLIFRSSRHD